MKKKTINKITLFTALGLGVVLLASCTANLSSNKDKANILFTYDMGTTRYTNDSSDPEYVKATKKEEMKTTGGGIIYTWQDVEKDYNYGKQDNQTHIARIFNVNDSQSVYKSAESSGVKMPSLNFWFEFDKRVLKDAWKAHFNKEFDSATSTELTLDNVREALDYCGGQVKFSGGTNNNFTYFDKTTQDIRDDINKGILSDFTVDDCPNTDFTTLYKNYLNNKVNNIRSCIAIYGGEYGNFGWNHNRVTIEAKTWGYAWSKGVISGLVVFPIAWLTETFSNSFGMNNGYNGVAQLGAILCVTFIVRTFLLLVSLRSTIGQQKMQMLQPELNKIQAKYPNANTNMAQKQRLSQEQNALYKKNNIHPLSTLLVLIVQFPLFIGVWGAMQGSASLASGQVLNLYLSDSIWSVLVASKGLPSNSGGWWTAFTLIIIMSLAQFVSMKLPQWMQKAREKKQPKLTANPAQTKSQKQMKWFGYIMLAMIIIMGFTLPAGMGVYWLAGALFSIVQTVVMQFIIGGQFKQFGRWCKATWFKFIGLFKKKEQN